MAKDENVVITKDLSFGELLRFFASTLGMKQRMEQTIHVPDAIYERIIETNSLHVIHAAIDDLIAVLDGVVGVEPTELMLLTSILSMHKLDEIRAVCCDRLGRIEEAKVLRDFMARRGNPTYEPEMLGELFTFDDAAMQIEQLSRRPMMQVDLSRIHAKGYVDDGWRREVDSNGPTDWMVRGVTPAAFISDPHIAKPPRNRRPIVKLGTPRVHHHEKLTRIHDHWSFHGVTVSKVEGQKPRRLYYRTNLIPHLSDESLIKAAKLAGSFGWNRVILFMPYEGSGKIVLCNFAQFSHDDILNLDALPIVCAYTEEGE